MSYTYAFLLSMESVNMVWCSRIDALLSRSSNAIGIVLSQCYSGIDDVYTHNNDENPPSRKLKPL